MTRELEILQSELQGEAGAGTLLLILIYHLAENWLQCSTGSTSWRGVQHYDDSIALMVQLAQGKLALVPVLVDIKLVFSSSLLLLLRLQVLVLHPVHYMYNSV